MSYILKTKDIFNKGQAQFVVFFYHFDQSNSSEVKELLSLTFAVFYFEFCGRNKSHDLICIRHTLQYKIFCDVIILRKP